MAIEALGVRDRCKERQPLLTGSVHAVIALVACAVDMDSSSICAVEITKRKRNVPVGGQRSGRGNQFEWLQPDRLSWLA